MSERQRACLHGQTFEVFFHGQTVFAGQTAVKFFSGKVTELSVTG